MCKRNNTKHTHIKQFPCISVASAFTEHFRHVWTDTDGYGYSRTEVPSLLYMHMCTKEGCGLGPNMSPFLECTIIRARVAIWARGCDTALLTNDLCKRDIYLAIFSNISQISLIERIIYTKTPHEINSENLLCSARKSNMNLNKCSGIKMSPVIALCSCFHRYLRSLSCNHF